MSLTLTAGSGLFVRGRVPRFAVLVRLGRERRERRHELRRVHVQLDEFLLQIAGTRVGRHIGFLPRVRRRRRRVVGHICCGRLSVGTIRRPVRSRVNCARAQRMMTTMPRKERTQSIEKTTDVGSNTEKRVSERGEESEVKKKKKEEIIESRDTAAVCTIQV